MLFSSTVFLFFFLPVVLLFHHVIFRKSRLLQNIFLTLASLFFYAWGEPHFVLIMMGSIVINWILGLLTDRYRDDVRGKWMVALSVITNLSIIFIFKYLGFAIRNMNRLFHTEWTDPGLALPIGISFFTFQALSYVIDVYRKKGEPQKNPLNVALYISFFPQLIAGPIVRYETVAREIRERKLTFDDFAEGVSRFIIGLGKKVLLANNMAIVADRAFLLQQTQTWQGAHVPLTAPMAWLGAIAYTFQIFYDFSGYSDMAIGLGRMFGFHFLENFDYPYISQSVTEFWRRWHISLGSWFRDYVYIPLGGSRVSKGRHILNLFVVWLCTGIWHGANWTFIFWGLAYFVLITAEKFTGLDRKRKHVISRVLQCLVTLFLVILGWVIFRSDSITQAFGYIRQMFSAGPALGDPLTSTDALAAGASVTDVFTAGATGLSTDIFLLYFRQNLVYLIAAVIFAIPVVPWMGRKWGKHPIYRVVTGILLLLVFATSISFLIKGSYNPFIYFNF